MRALALLLFVTITLAGCRGQWRWVDEVAVVPCPGGRINQERRTVDSLVGGRVRNTVVKTDACLE